jgi:hypothetical protein
MSEIYNGEYHRDRIKELIAHVYGVDYNKEGYILDNLIDEYMLYEQATGTECPSSSEIGEALFKAIMSLNQEGKVE